MGTWFGCTQTNPETSGPNSYVWALPETLQTFFFASTERLLTESLLFGINREKSDNRQNLAISCPGWLMS